MAFWSEAQVEPKRKFKFVVTITGDSTKNIVIPSYVIKKADKPSFTISETKHSFLGHNFFFPGKLEWKEVSITLVDAAGYNEKDEPDLAGTADDGISDSSGEIQTDQTFSVMRLLHEFGYQHPVQTAAAMAGSGVVSGGAKTFSKWAGTAALGGVIFQSLDSNGEVIEQWTLKNAWLKEVTFGDGDYSSDDVVDIQLKIRYDWAEFTKSPLGTTTIYPTP